MLEAEQNPAPAKTLTAAPAEEAKPEPKEVKTKDQKRQEAEERNRLYKERKKFEDQLRPVEKKIETKEARKDEISALLCDAEVLADSSKVQSLMIELKDIEAELVTLNEKWEELAEKIAEIN